MDWFSAKHLARKSVTPLSVAVIPPLVAVPRFTVPSDPQVTLVAEEVRLTFPPAVLGVVFLQFGKGEVEPSIGSTVCPAFSIQYAAKSIMQALAIGSA